MKAGTTSYNCSYNLLCGGELLLSIACKAALDNLILRWSVNMYLPSNPASNYVCIFGCELKLCSV